MRLPKTVVSLVLSILTISAASTMVKRDSWGPSFSLGPAKHTIITTTTTIYPAAMPHPQPGLLYTWLGMSNGTGDLIQSIVGSYPKGQSECSGANADTDWCISSEVYGNLNGHPNQWVGSQRTAWANYTNGVRVNYTLIDRATWMWEQTMTDAVTGQLLSTFKKTSGPMTGWGTANECNDVRGAHCAHTTATQYYVNSTIVLETADPSFSNTKGAQMGATYTDMKTADSGKTWTIAKITVPTW